MRHVVVLFFALTLLTPLAASAGSESECRYLSQQIAFFEARSARAAELDHDVWEGRFESHLGELQDRRSRSCPGFGADEQAQRAFMELVKIGARAALSYFTMGAM